jgi:hypothetical protein
LLVLVLRINNMAKRKKPLDADKRNVLDRRTISIAIYCVLRVACELIFTNMAATQIFNVTSEKLNMFRICT